MFSEIDFRQLNEDELFCLRFSLCPGCLESLRIGELSCDNASLLMMICVECCLMYRGDKGIIEGGGEEL